MAGWSKAKAERTKAAFYEFLGKTVIKSKERGFIVLRDHLYGAQTMVIDAIFDGLAEDKHDFKILKSRQLGVSTIVRALMTFWAGVFPVTAVLVFDTSQHLLEARQELVDMMEQFPASFKFPRITGNNRYSLTLSNTSRINFVAAGVRETKSSGTLGRGSAVSVAHRSELCSYGNASGIEAFRASLARENPDRLFVDESTARGPNLWKEIWDEARGDHHCVCVFCGWWSHPGQRIDRKDPDFEIYGKALPTSQEKEKMRIVWEQYSHQITAEQLAWIRREMNPVANDDDDDGIDYSGDPLRIQEQPWYEEEAFQITGAVFFDPVKLTEQINKNVSRRYASWSFEAGVEFNNFRVFKSPNPRSTQLKIWEEPVEGSVYVVSADPAFGHSEKSDRSCVQVLRCFSDGIDQVAEYAWPLIDSRQFAWVIAALEAWYSGESSIIYRIVEINGPGEATWRELMSLRHQLQQGYFGREFKEKGLENIQRNVRNYTYTRSDAAHPGSSWQWKTFSQLKIAIMERLRDFTNAGILRVRSHDTIEEMRTIAREGDSIEAAGSAKDDRVMALAMGIRCWDERVRRNLVTTKRTRQFEEAKRKMTMRDQINLYNESQFDSFLKGKGVIRQRALSEARRRSWRSS